MSDQILTNDEKDALRSGVESGEVEVQSVDGPRYAKVMDFEIAPRNRLVTESYPRLQKMNRKLAGLIAKSSSSLLNETVDVRPIRIGTSTFGEFCERAAEAALIFEFTARPLDGSAAVRIPAGVVRHIVEIFYGGSRTRPPNVQIAGFTPGETSALGLFCGEILEGLAETWRDVIVIELEGKGLHQSTDVVEVIDGSAPVIFSEFVLCLGDAEHEFQIVWPAPMLAPLLPVLAGEKRERNPQQDARWEQAMRSRLSDAPVSISAQIGSARLSLRDIAGLAPGDIIALENPQQGILSTRNVAVLEGRFGAHDGRYAIEARRWIAAPGQARTGSAHRQLPRGSRQ